MLVMCNVLHAQDTVPFGHFDNYFVYGNVPKLENCRHHYVTSMDFPGGGGESGKYFFSADSLTIYGIAAGVREYTLCDYLADTTYDNCIEYLRLYNPVADTLQCLNQVPVHLHHNVTYYMNCDTAFPPSRNTLITEMHERYFTSPTTVVDSFYVGCTFFLFNNINGHEFDFQCHPFCISSIASVDILDEENYILCFRRRNLWVRTSQYEFALIFPILTPNPDTTLSASEPDMLRRYTAVTPNPVTGRAKVVSSFGLTMVEAFNAAGEKVHELRLPDTPLTVTLDVSRWPTGTYILRLHTPQGVATKKLIVK